MTAYGAAGAGPDGPTVTRLTRPAWSRILIANRGEVALRIIRAARALALETVAVHTVDEAAAPHAIQADFAVTIDSPGGYLDAQALVSAALRAGAGAVHPGYGFLAENAQFAQSCIDAGLCFIGPSPHTIGLMGDKSAARAAMVSAGLAVIPGYDGADQGDLRLHDEARQIGVPLMIKACSGGGGRGLRRVDRLEDFSAALRSARAEALAAFGDRSVLLERAVDEARHIEVQILADAHDHVIHFGERDCSVQRRYQKLIEEAPSPALDAAQRSVIGRSAVDAVRALGYEGLGTLEFLLAADGRLLFIEMNTRLQVEHPVTEAVYGIDLVQWQLRIALGERLADIARPKTAPSQHDVGDSMTAAPSGHAIEVRLCAEDPANGFLPQSGVLVRWGVPEGVRVEHALYDGAPVSPHYDSMIARLIVHGADREAARRQMLRALADLQAFGLPTNRDFLIRCLQHPLFIEGRADTGFVERCSDVLLEVRQPQVQQVIAAAACLLCVAPDELSAGTLLPRHPRPVRLAIGSEVVERITERRAGGLFTVSDDQQSLEVRVIRIDPDDTRLTVAGAPLRLRWWCEPNGIWLSSDELTLRVVDRSLEAATERARPAARGGLAVSGLVRAPMHARVVSVAVRQGEPVGAGDLLMTIEAMKIEYPVAAPCAGRVASLDVLPGALVQAGAPLVMIDTAGAN